MVRSDVKREAVAYLRAEHGLSEGRACHIVGARRISEGGMVFLCPQGQLSAPFADDRLSQAVAGLPSLVERVRHLFGHRLGVDLPDVLTLALSSPSQSVMDVLTEEGLGDLDLAAVAVLAVPCGHYPLPTGPPSRPYANTPDKLSLSAKGN